MKTLLLVSVALLMAGNAMAQWLGGAFYGRSNLSLQVGSQGFGAEFFQELPQKVGLRAGASFLPFSTRAIVESMSRATNDRLDVKASNVRLWFDYPLFNQLLRIVVGGSYFFKVNGTVNSVPTDDISNRFSFGSRQFTAQELGTLTTSVQWKGLKPYAGLSFFHNLDDKRFALTLDAGTYFLNSPKVNSASTGMLYLDDAAIQTLDQNMHSYQWMPLLQLGVRYSFNSNHF